jgi:hypothetical protein
MRFYAVPPHNQTPIKSIAVPPHNQTPIKSISSHLLRKSLLINYPCFKPFKTASEVSNRELWPLALLHVTPLALLHVIPLALLHVKPPNLT